MLVAQISDDDGLGLGGLFNGLKVNVNEYEEIITKFKSLENIGDFLDLDGNLDFDKLSKDIGELDALTQSYFNSLNKGKGVVDNSSASVEGMSAHLKATGQAYSFATIKATLFNTALNAGIFLIASLAIQGIVTAIDNYVHKAEKAIELTDELKSKHEELRSEYESHKKTVDELASSYEKLSKGVDTATNQNLELSDDDYEEYLRITNELAEAFPVLRETLDDNGNAILTLGQNGRTASEDLQLLLQSEEDLNNYKISQDIDGLFGGVKVKVDEAKKAFDEYKESSAKMEESFDVLKGLSEETIDLSEPIKLSGDTSTAAGIEYYNTLSKAIQNFTNSLDTNRAYELSDVFSLDNIVSMDENGVYDFYLNTTLLSEDEKDALANEIKAQASDIMPLVQDEITNSFEEQAQKKQEAELAWKDFLPSLVATMKSKGSFKELADEEFGEDIQNFAVDIVSNLDSSIAEQMDRTDPYAWVRNNIVLPLTQLEDSDRRIVADSYKKLFELNPNDLSQSNQSAIDSLIKTLSEKLGQTEFELRLNLGFEVDKDYQLKYGNAVVRTVEKLGVDKTEAENIFSELGIDTSAEIDKWNKIIAEIKDATEAKKKYLSEGGNTTTAPLSFTETLSELDKMQEKFNVLDKTLAKLYDEDSQIGLEDYSSINEAFADVEGIERYIQRLQEAGQNQEEVTDIMSDLTGAYINQTGILDKVNDENADLIAQTLTEMGVEGAHELVLQRLASAKEIASLKSFDLANATTSEILKLVEEGQVSDETAHYLLTYALKKQLANGTTLTTASDIENIKALVLALGGAIENLNAFQSAKNGVLRELKNPNGTKHTGNNKVYDEGSYGDINAAQDEIDAVLNEPYKYRGGNATSKAVSSGSSSGGGSNKDSQKETKEDFDWIEIRLKRLSEQTSDLGDKFSKAFTLSSAESVYKDYLAAIGTEIEANNQAIAYYQQKLNEVGLAYEWIMKIQNGALDVSTITDENLINQINQYQSYYDKVLSAQQTLKRLEEERLQAQADYAKKITEQHEREIKQAKKLMNFYKFIVDLKDTFGMLASRDDLRNEQYVSATQIEMLEEQNNQMTQLLYTVDYMSEAWQTYYNKIEENKESIKELTKELADLAMEMANLPIEKYNQYLDKSAGKNELYSAKLNNYTSTKSKNKTIDKQIALADKNNAQAQKTAEETAKNLEWASGQNFKDAWDMDYVKAVYYGQTAQAEQIKTYYAEIQKYVKSGKQVPSSLISQLSEGNYASLIYAVNNYNASLIANETAQATAKLSAEQTKTEKRTLQMAKFNNIQTKYERKQDDIAHKASTLSSKMDLAVAKGYLASQGWYEQLIAYEKKNQSSLKKELADMQKEFAKMEKNTDEWWEMQDAIEDVTESINEGAVALQEYKDALEQVNFDHFDYLQEQISRLTSESDFLINSMSNKELKNDDGLTDYGLATMGLHVQNYDTYYAQAKKYREMIAEINADLKKTPYDTDLINQLHEYEDAQRDCILAAEDEKKAVADLMKEGYDALID